MKNIYGKLGTNFYYFTNMPRTHRLEFPGALVHIMNRRLDGESLFRDDEDRDFFLGVLAANLMRTRYLCYAWALMDNHYHLLLRTSDLPMSKLMRPLNGAYGRRYNMKYGRRGYLFQDRFKSVLCQDQEYAKQLIRYIHLNPLRAGLVRDLDHLAKWEWCGHGFLLGISGARGAGFQVREESLRRFGTDKGQAIRGYLTYLREGLENEVESAGHLPESGHGEIGGIQGASGNHRESRVRENCI